MLIQNKIWTSGSSLGKPLSKDPAFAKFHRHKFVLAATNEVVELDLPTGHGASWASVTAGGAKGFAGSRHMAAGRTLGYLMKMLGHSRSGV